MQKFLNIIPDDSVPTKFFITCPFQTEIDIIFIAMDCLLIINIGNALMYEARKTMIKIIFFLTLLDKVLNEFKIHK